MVLQKYIISNDTHVINRHYFACRKVRMPFIKVREDGNHYTVQVDTITAGTKVTPRGQYLIKQLFDAEFEENKKRHMKNPRSDYAIGPEICAFEPVVAKRVDEFCNKLFDIAIKNSGDERVTLSQSKFWNEEIVN